MGHTRSFIFSVARVSAVVSALAWTVPAKAEGRLVIVNGVVMGPANLQVLDSLAGAPVPDGAYWLNTTTGVWGYEGNAVPQGRLSRNRPPMASTWSGNDWGAGGPGYNRRTPGGDLMGDGACAFVAGVPVGACD